MCVWSTDFFCSLNKQNLTIRYLKLTNWDIEIVQRGM